MGEGGGGWGVWGGWLQGAWVGPPPKNFKIFNIENYQKRTEHENLVISLSICMETHKRTGSSPVPPTNLLLKYCFKC